MEAVFGFDQPHEGLHRCGALELHVEPNVGQGREHLAQRGNLDAQASQRRSLAPHRSEVEGRIEACELLPFHIPNGACAVGAAFQRVVVSDDQLSV